MTRDMNLIRQVMLDLESFNQRPGGISHIMPDEFDIEGYSPDQIEYHLKLVSEAGFIDTGDARPMEGIGFRSLTWKGHDFLDSVRDKTVWEKTKTTAERAGGFSVDLLVGIAKEIIKANIVRLL